MSYIKLTGVGDRVSGEKILNGLSAEGLACTGMSKTMEGESNVITFELADGEGAAYRNAQTKADLLIKFSEAFKRTEIYIIGLLSGSTANSTRAKFVEKEIAQLNAGIVQSGGGTWHLSAEVATIKPPPSSPPYGSLEWAKLILPDS